MPVVLCLRVRLRTLLVLACLAFTLAAVAQPSATTTQRRLRVQVHDQQNQPVAGAQVAIRSKGKTLASAVTDGQGGAILLLPPTDHIELTLNADGFEPLTSRDVDVATAEVEVTLLPKLEARETVSVSAGEQPTVSTTQDMGRAEIKQLPNRPANVADAIAYTPGVVNGPDGLAIAGGDQIHNALIVNSVDSTDPATGIFGLLVPVDSVETLSVAATPFEAQYGNFTSGVVSAQTRRGGEKWNFELNDPLPEFRIRSAHLEGLRSATPNVSFSGPVIPQKLYFAQTAQVFLKKVPVRTLPFPFNETRTADANLFSQADLVLSPKHTLTGTFHLTPQNTDWAGLSFFNPQPVTPNIHGLAYALSAIDRLQVGAGVLQSTVARQSFHVDVAPQGPAEMAISPLGNSGNYFSSQNRDSGRVSWLETYSLNPLTFAGTHSLQFGTETSFTGDHGQFFARPVNITDASGNLLRRIDFTGGTPFSKSDVEFAAFAQDHWMLNSRLLFDAGVRLEQQGITDTVRYAPRAGISWSPFGAKHSTVVRGGAGVFYDHVPLNVYAFGNYPDQVITTFDGQGHVLNGPTTFFNVIDVSGSRFRLVDRDPGHPGEFAPYSVASSVELEQRISRLLRVQAKYSLRNSHGLVTVAPQLLANGTNAFLMQDSGSSRYREFQLMLRIAEERKRKLFISYVHSAAQGTVDAIHTYIGDIAFPVIRPSFFTRLSSDTPDRILIWGEMPLKWKMKVSPLLEYRTGFPYSVTNTLQDYVGVPNTSRFPSYFSLDMRVSKDFQVTQKYALRLSLRGLNLTNHFNALDVHSNITDPQFGTFFGTYPRKFMLDMDVLF